MRCRVDALAMPKAPKNALGADENMDRQDDKKRVASTGSTGKAGLPISNRRLSLPSYESPLKRKGETATRLSSGFDASPGAWRSSDGRQQGQPPIIQGGTPIGNRFGTRSTSTSKVNGEREQSGPPAGLSHRSDGGAGRGVGSMRIYYGPDKDTAPTEPGETKASFEAPSWWRSSGDDGGAGGRAGGGGDEGGGGSVAAGPDRNKEQGDQQDADPVQRLHELHQQRLMWAQLANNQAGTARSTTSAGVKAQGHVALAPSDADNGAAIPVFSSSST